MKKNGTVFHERIRGTKSILMVSKKWHDCLPFANHRGDPHTLPPPPPSYEPNVMNHLRHHIPVTMFTAVLFGLPLALGCSKSQETPNEESTPEAKAVGPGVGASVAPSPNVTKESWRTKPLLELCKDWKGAYYPPKGHTSSDTPGAEISSSAIACGYRPVGWNGERTMLHELSDDLAKKTSAKAWARAEALMRTDGRSAHHAMEVLQKEFDLEHIGTGEVYGKATLHFTVRNGAPLIVHPRDWEPLQNKHPEGSDLDALGLYQRCRFGVGYYYPPRGHTPMDRPTERALKQPSFLCGLKFPEPLPQELSTELVDQQNAIRLRLRELLGEGVTTKEAAATVRREFDDIEFDHLTYGAPELLSMHFRIKGGTTQHANKPFPSEQPKQP